MKQIVSHPIFMIGFLLLMAVVNAAAMADGKGLRPNILIIMADDATFSDLPIYGGNNLTTPNINTLAGEGLTFNKAYVSMSMSVPCRASLYTGLYPVKNGVCWNHTPARNNTRSIVQYLEDLGYRTGLAGKVHATPEEVFPFEMVEGIERNCVSVTADFEISGLRKFISRDDKQPFCLVAALVVPHIPWTVGDPSHFDPAGIKFPDYLADTKETREQFVRYLAELEVLDQQVGALLDMLAETGTADNTLVMFTSEQGAQMPGCKWTNWDKGVHTGMIFRWPGRIKPGTRTDALVQYEDVLPTLIEAAGGEVAEHRFDGNSFLDVLEGRSECHRSFAYFMHNNTPEGTPYPIRSVTDGRYHYIRNLKPENLFIEKHLMAGMPLNSFWSSWIFQASEDPHSFFLVQRYLIRPPHQLYDLQVDPDEMVDLSGQSVFRNTLEKLSGELDKWMKEQGDPGEVIDNKTEWQNANAGNHFLRVAQQ